MRGTILGVHGTIGVLVTDDHRRFDFPLSEWRSAGTPAAGQIVDFVEEGGQAKAVFAVPGVTSSGGVGGHSGSFTLGAIALGCLALGFVIPVLPTIAAYVLGVIGAQQARAEGDPNALLMSRIAWIGALALIVLGFLLLLTVAGVVGAMGWGHHWNWD